MNASKMSEKFENMLHEQILYRVIQPQYIVE